MSTGGPTMEFMAPKLDQAVQAVEALLGQSLNMPKVPPLSMTELMLLHMSTRMSLACRSN